MYVSRTGKDRGKLRILTWNAPNMDLEYTCIILFSSRKEMQKEYQN